MPLQNSEARAQLKKHVADYRRAITYLDTCGELTVDKLLEAGRIAGQGPSEQWVRSMWARANNILPDVGEGPGGREQLRYEMRKSMMEAIAQFEKLVGPSKRFWHLWK